jgi:hypothetical protein
MKFTLLAIMLALIVCSCTKEQSIIPPSDNWSGKYTGLRDSGTFKITITNGEVTGTSTSYVYRETVDVHGTLTNGTLRATAGTATSGATFNGTVYTTSANGTWYNTYQFTGTWSAVKY